MKQVSKAPLVSVIVPAYNAAPYANRCLDSIIKQTYKNLEIILVDDGSTDNTGEIFDHYAKNEKRIKVIHQKNGGLSDARNNGIKIAKGDLIGFVDCDDWINAEMYEKMVKALLNTDADIVTCKLIRPKDTNDTTFNKKKYDSSITVLDRAEYMKKYFKIEKNITDYYAWNKLYKRELIDNNQYPVGLTCEDVLGTYRALKKARCVAEINYPYYYYYINNAGITGSKFSSKDFDLLKVWNLLLHESLPEDRTYAQKNVQRIDYTILMRMAQAMSYREISTKYGLEMNCLLKRVKQNWKKIIAIKSFSIIRKVSLILIVSNYRLFVLIEHSMRGKC